jgi:hypothetical protein
LIGVGLDRVWSGGGDRALRVWRDPGAPLDVDDSYVVVVVVVVLIGF